MSARVADITESELLDDLSAVAAAIRTANKDLTGLYVRRRQLIEQCRERVPPIHLRVIGEACGITDVAVIYASRGRGQAKK